MRRARFVGLDLQKIEIAVAIVEEGRNGEVLSDNALQIHGDAGFTLECPVSRVLCDARILDIFEDAPEIQARVIARRLPEGGN